MEKLDGSNTNILFDIFSECSFRFVLCQIFQCAMMWTLCDVKLDVGGTVALESSFCGVNLGWGCPVFTM